MQPTDTYWRSLSLQPYLPELCTLTLCLLEGAAQQEQQAQQAQQAGAEGERGGEEHEAQGRREVRTRCLRLLAGAALILSFQALEEARDLLVQPQPQPQPFLGEARCVA